MCVIFRSLNKFIKKLDSNFFLMILHKCIYLKLLFGKQKYSYFRTDRIAASYYHYIWLEYNFWLASA